MSSRSGRRRSARWGAVALAAVGALVLAASPASAHSDPITDAESQQAYSHVLGKAALASAQATLPAAFFNPAATADAPQITGLSGTLTRNPDRGGAAAFETPDTACADPSCKEVSVTVPAGSDQTLYARATWLKNTQYVHVWGIAPDGTYVGNSTVDSSYDKTIGNTDVSPLAEFSVKNPMAGVWRIQIRAVFGYQIPVTGAVVLAKGSPLTGPDLDVRQLADAYLTQKLTYNIVFVNRVWTKDEITAFRNALPSEIRPAVLEKQFSDGCASADNPASEGTEAAGTLVNWGQAHYCGTAGGGSTGYVPAFEPLKASVSYRFLQADDTWTGDLFAQMQANTKTDGATFSATPPVGSRRLTQGDYISTYDKSDGTVYRGTANTVANPLNGDTIDPFPVEDWIFAHRNDARYKASFTDLDSGAKVSGSFIDPDPNAYYDPFYTAKGTKNLDVMPQGTTNSWTFFALDTFDGPLAAKYFRPSAYHYFDVSAHEDDPDLGTAGGPNDIRAWGGRYKFFMHDLGAGPNSYEASDTVLTKEVGGSAMYPTGDPPIWDYTSNPEWSGMLAARTARDAGVWLFGRFYADYLYRPIPADSYLLADNNWVDCESNPQCDPTGVSYTDLDKLYHPVYVAHNLSAALPGATFNDETSIPGLVTDRYLGCSTMKAVANPDAATTGAPALVEVPNPTCTGPGDPLQELLEQAKAAGDEVANAGVNDAAASPAVVRAYVEEHRDQLAPQPAGQFTVTNISVVFPGATTWDLPALVGGIAYGTPNGEAWGVLNNVNDRFKWSGATDCSKSLAAAPGCNGVPPISGGDGFSYTLEHESSHFLGLTHPHDYLTVEKDADGKDDYYADAFSNYADFSQAPTTYAGSFAPYSVLDQDTIQRGHEAEYLRQAQDYLNDAYTADGMAGLSAASAGTQAKVSATNAWRTEATQLNACGDYLHGERAMRNASLTAQGIFGPLQDPRTLKAGEQVLFNVHPQTAYNADGTVRADCLSATSAGTAAPVTATKAAAAKTAAAKKAAKKKPAKKATQARTVSSKAPLHITQVTRTLAFTGMSPVLGEIALALMLGALIMMRRVRRRARA